ncbi:hypothetical protein RIR_e7452_A0A2I1F3X0_9GLOM [Rhizophagus irregularis DAOM 181602=DAOM 197198]|nr:hypothetical protein RhiirB3_445539 [Rhizophagus irregularis]GBC22832.2 hypothetical protein RIR_e7452_A0A2I1F3X0_9GLOM [Rhizophagus irregularis DAOM 181602=DAOM 197198]
MTGSTWSTYFILPNNPFEKYEADSIKDTVPVWVTWQFPIERIFGMLLPYA